MEKDWHYVDEDEVAKLMAAAKPGWRLLFGLARWAGLRLEEALELPWRKIDWEKRRLTVISRDDINDEGAFTVEEASALSMGAKLVDHLTDASLRKQMETALLKIRSVRGACEGCSRSQASAASGQLPAFTASAR